MSKTKLISGLLGLTACVLFSRLLFAEDVDWQFKKEEKGVKVYVHEIEGSALKEFRGVALVNTTMDRILAVFEDTAGGCSWIYKCKEFKEIEEKSPTEKFFYFRQELSWPVLDRDVVDYRIRNQDPLTQVLTYRISEASPDLYPYPKQKNVV
ncbi:MAG: hypothetical protein HYS55_03330, partial [Candidatus Omnitrophica bacterium]|nr:hypothetical protein [Candidatus Omnitrophota bacterium]